MRRRLLGNIDIKIIKIELEDTVAGDIVFYDPDKVVYTYYRFGNVGDDEIPINNIPIGVVVVPASHNIYNSQSCGVMSLMEMNYSNPDYGSNSYQAMCWGGLGIDNSIMNYNEVCYVGDKGIINSTIQGVNGYGYLPSDNFYALTDDVKGLMNTLDMKTYYYLNSDKYIPSPYNNDGSRNSLYYQTASLSSTSNAMSNFSGVGNTKNLCENITQLNWKTSQFIDNKFDTGYYPASACCWRFHTEGTKQGDWYLPSCGEFGYVITRLREINQAIKNLIYIYNGELGTIVNENNIYITSTEFDTNHSMGINMIDGEVYPCVKSGNHLVRAFLRLNADVSTWHKNYGDILISGGAATLIPAHGGESSITGYTYSQTYGFGDSITDGGVINSGADIEIIPVSADSLYDNPTNTKTYIGDSILNVSMNNKKASKSYETYQDINTKSIKSITGGEVTYDDIVKGAITNAIIPAKGGVGTATASNGSQKWYKSATIITYIYTSGSETSEENEASSNGSISVSPSSTSYSASAGSKGTDPSDITEVGKKEVKWDANGKTVTDYMYVYQEANTRKPINVSGGGFIYDDIVKGTITNATIPAKGGTATATASNGSQKWYKADTITTYEYTSTATKDEITEKASSGTISVSPSSTSYSASAGSKGTDPSDVTEVGKKEVKWDANGKTATDYMYVYQEANTRKPINVSGGDYTYDDIVKGTITNATIPAKGGTATATASNGSQKWYKSATITTYEYTSTATKDEITESETSGTISVSPSPTSYSASAGSKGIDPSNITEVGKKEVKWDANGKTATDYMYVYQAANTKFSTGLSGGDYTYGNVIKGAITNTTVEAWGGDATVTASNGSQDWAKSDTIIHYEFDSGETEQEIYENASTGTNTIVPDYTSITKTIDSKGVLESGETIAFQQLVTWQGGGGKKSTDYLYIYQKENRPTQTGISIAAGQPDSSWNSTDWSNLSAGEVYLGVYGYRDFIYTSKDEQKGVFVGNLTSNLIYTTSIAEQWRNGGLKIKSRGTDTGDARTGSVYWTDNGFTSNTLYYTQRANSKWVSHTTGGKVSYSHMRGAGPIYEPADIPAAGGTATITAGNSHQEYTKSATITHYAYTSGATSSATTEQASSGTVNIYPNISSFSASAGPRACEDNSQRLMIASKDFSWTANYVDGDVAPHMYTDYGYIYQAANYIVSASYDYPSINIFSYSNVPASGGTRVPSFSATQVKTNTWASNGVTNETLGPWDASSSIVTFSMNNSSYATLNNSTGAVTFSENTGSSSRSVNVTAKVSQKGKTSQKTVTVTQNAYINKIINVYNDARMWITVTFSMGSTTVGKMDSERGTTQVNIKCEDGQNLNLTFELDRSFNPSAGQINFVITSNGYDTIRGITSLPVGTSTGQGTLTIDELKAGYGIRCYEG